MEKGIIFLLIALHLRLSSCGPLGPAGPKQQVLQFAPKTIDIAPFLDPPLAVEKVNVGFEFVRHNTSELSSQQVCLLVNGSVRWSFYLIVNSHVGVADESDYTPLRDRSILIPPGIPRVCIFVIINNDLVVEGEETFTLTLEEPAGGLRNGITINPKNNGTIIRIIDNDLPPNCLSFLRFVKPHLFQHCRSTCTYFTISDWKTVPGTEVLVPLGICESGVAHTRSRQQTAPQQGCPVKTEQRQLCILLDSERLIRIFNLGRPKPEPGLPELPQGPPAKPGVPEPPGLPQGPLKPNSLILWPTGLPQELPEKPRAPGQQCSSTRACENIGIDERQCTDQVNCKPKHYNECQLRSMIFVMDTSGSIGPTNFQKMTNAIANFVPLLCDNMKIAIISYSRNIRVEFCFNCYNLCNNETDCFTDRYNVVSAIRGIQYRGGSTHTGVASRCVSDYILDPSSDCGADVSSNCLDIIYVTDGRSNGPLRYPQTCMEATCLRNHPDWCGKVNTYAIAIGSGVNREEINCITQNDEDSVFNVDDFAQFEQLIQTASNKLNDTNSDYLCVKHTDKCILL